MRRSASLSILLIASVLEISLLASAAAAGFGPLLTPDLARPPFKRIVICLDGTWNNPYRVKKRLGEENVMKPTNVLKTCRAVLPVAEDGVRQLAYYDIGVGGLHKYPGVYNRIASSVDSVLGGAWGAGFEARIENAYRFLALNYEPGDQVYVFGFSRGAATARALTRFIYWMRETTDDPEVAAAGGVPPKDQEYWTPHFFKAYLQHKGAKSSAEVWDDLWDGIVERKREDGKSQGEAEAIANDLLGDFLPVEIRFLGVWETVLALGSRLKANNTSRDYFLGDSPAGNVKVARQALGIDERRFDFSPWIWASPGASDLEQRWFAGVHSNIGGGYADDGLANVALAWMLREAQAEALGLDWAFLSHYPTYMQDQLYDSRKWFYRFKEAVTFRLRKGIRSLALDSQASVDRANLFLDCSVLKRARSDPRETTSPTSQEIRHPPLQGRWYGLETRAFVRYLSGCPAHDDWLGANPLRGRSTGTDAASGACLPVRPNFTIRADGPKEQTCLPKSGSDPEPAESSR